MAIKYYCPKCGRRFVDWGAEKLGYKCPSEECKGEELILPGAEPQEFLDAQGKVKRSKKRKPIIPIAAIEDMDVPDLEEDFADDVDLDVEEDMEVEDIDSDILPVIASDEDEEVPLEEEVVDADEVLTDDETFPDDIDLGDEEIEED